MTGPSGSRIEVGVSLGSNIGDKAAHIRAAVAALGNDGVLADLTVSSLYRTAPWGHVVEQDWFVNACAFGFTSLAPTDLLSRCKIIEKRLGRTATVRWGPRVIDIDLLYYGDLTLDTPGLTIPHKDMLQRAFVLVPLAEIRPEQIIGGTTVARAARALPSSDIIPISEADESPPDER